MLSNNRTLFLLALTLLVCSLVFSFSCSSDDDDDDDDNDDNDNDAPTGVEALRFDFRFEYRDSGTLILYRHEDGTLAGTMGVETGNDLLPGGLYMNGTGRMVDFPESGYKMISMEFTGVPTGGACGEEALTYTLVLTYKLDNAFLVGHIGAYCGDDTLARPVRLMRIKGNLERLEAAPE